MTAAAYKKARLLKETLPRECAGRSLLDLYPGQGKTAGYGPVVLVLEESGTMPKLDRERAMSEAWILRTLQLLYGIGKTAATPLELAGYTALRDPLAYPCWAWQAEQILAAVRRRRLPALNRRVT